MAGLHHLGGPPICTIDLARAEFQITTKGVVYNLQCWDVAISMDVPGRVLDNIFVEWLWCRLRHEDTYLRSTPSRGSVLHESKESLCILVLP